MVPLHEVRDQGKLQTLVNSIGENGWQGVPLVIWAGYGDLLTGSHRYAAAKELGWDDSEIPTIDIADVFAEAGLNFMQILEENDNPHWSEWGFLYVLDELPANITEKYGIDIH